MEPKSETFLRRVASVRGAAVLREDLVAALALLDEERRLNRELTSELLRMAAAVHEVREQLACASA